MNTSKLTPVIGIEVHVELRTNSKMFCGCDANHFGKEPNTLTCPVCLGLPGALPVPNKKAVDWTIMIGLALNCHINHHSKFDRKHYFYPDLPKGYQISQYDEPLCEKGTLDITNKTIGITRVHLEEDTGKLQHKKVDGQDVSLVDFNRSGVALVEIVSEPDLTTSKEAKEYTKNLARIIRFLEVSDADMDKGSMRLEANISWGMDLGYKVEVKNINSFNYLQKAIEYELKRQKELLDQGKTPAQETRGFNENSGKTFSQRSKEEAMDYRYFPEPDIPAMEFSDHDIDKIRQQLPKLPHQVKARWSSQYQIKQQYLNVLLNSAQTVAYTDQALQLALQEKLKPNDVAGTIVNQKIDIQKVSPKKLIQQIKQANDKITDSDQIGEWVKQAIADHPKVVADYQGGKDSALQFLVGQVMKHSRGQADAATAIKLLQFKLQ